MKEEIEIQKSTQLLHWLIDGINIHCIPFYLWKFVTYDWVKQNYNFYEIRNNKH